MGICGLSAATTSFWSRQASTTTDSDQGNPSRRQARQAYSNGHTATATTYNKHPVTDALQQQLRTMMSAIQGRKAFVQCAILVAVVLLALIANAAAQEHRRHGGRHSPRPHSPAVADGNLFNLPLIPLTAITYRFLAPVLSAQLMTAPTGRAREIRNLPPAEPPRPLFDILDF